MDEATQWINDQPGADAGVREMCDLGPDRSMIAEMDGDALLRSFAYGRDDDGSAHNLMVRAVQRVVYQSTENKAGLVLALDVIERAYLRLMELRRAGRVEGESRPDADARNDFYRAVRGAVAKGRARGNSPAPQRTSDGRIALRTRRESGPTT